MGWGICKQGGSKWERESFNTTFGLGCSLPKPLGTVQRCLATEPWERGAGEWRARWQQKAMKHEPSSSPLQPTKFLLHIVPITRALN